MSSQLSTSHSKHAYVSVLHDLALTLQPVLIPTRRHPTDAFDHMSTSNVLGHPLSYLTLTLPQT